MSPENYLRSLQAQVRALDTKAAAGVTVLVLSGAFIASGLSRISNSSVSASGGPGSLAGEATPYPIALGLIAFTLLVSAGILLIASVVPRLRAPNTKGEVNIYYFDDVASFETPDQLQQAWTNSTDDARLEMLIEQIHTLAKITRTKALLIYIACWLTGLMLLAILGSLACEYWA